MKHVDLCPVDQQICTMSVWEYIKAEQKKKKHFCGLCTFHLPRWIIYMFVLFRWQISQCRRQECMMTYLPTSRDSLIPSEVHEPGLDGYALNNICIVSLWTQLWVLWYCMMWSAVLPTLGKAFWLVRRKNSAAEKEIRLPNKFEFWRPLLYKIDWHSLP